MSAPDLRSGRVRGRVFLAALAATTVVALVATPLLAGAATAPPSGPPTADAPTAAGLGAGYLARRLDAGLPLPGFGGPDWGLTLQAGLALAETGIGVDRLPGLWAAVEADRETVVAPGGTDEPGRLARVVLLATLLGEDPGAVGGGPGADAVARLSATLRTSGPDIGLFGAGDALYDGAFRQGLAMAALAAAGASIPQASIDWLLTQQCADGSWGGARADLAAPCAFDPDTFSGPDTNNTALALIGLAAAGWPRVPGGAQEQGLGWLASAQEADGGWGYRPGDGTDPNSTALVRRALATLDATTADGIEDSTRALLSFQVGCGEPATERGGFASPFSAGLSDLIATVDAVPGVAGLPLPVAAATPSADLPVVDCTLPTTTTTTTTTTSVPPTGPGGGPEDGATTTVPAARRTDAATGEVLPQALAAPSVLPAGNTARLAVTGTDAPLVAVVGAGLLVGGLALVRPGRRRTL
jgi:hypothetical protein